MTDEIELKPCPFCGEQMVECEYTLKTERDYVERGVYSELYDHRRIIRHPENQCFMASLGRNNFMYSNKTAWNTRPDQWQDIETAPKGVEKHGKKGISWMMLAYPDKEGEFNAVNGMRIGDKFFVCGIFYCGGPFDRKQYELREVEVTPTHWQPLPTSPNEGADK